MRFGSICSGIEAASVAWLPLGWDCAFASEIELFPRGVIGYRFPDLELYGDFREIEGVVGIDVLVGGPPCQTFSVAGRREGIDTERGNLALEFVRLVERVQPRWFVFENVPGLVISGGGGDFARIVRGFRDCGYGCAWRVLDARFFGVPQRRRRVFVIGYLGDWRPPASVLFVGEGDTGDIGAGKEDASGVAGGDGGCASGLVSVANLSGNSLTPLVVAGAASNAEVCEGMVPTLKARDFKDAPIVIAGGSANSEYMVNGVPTLLKSNAARPPILMDSIVRRLTPLECERAMGFPDGWTEIPWRGRLAKDCPKSPRYAAIGNSMAVPVMRWLGERIAVADEVL